MRPSLTLLSLVSAASLALTTGTQTAQDDSEAAQKTPPTLSPEAQRFDKDGDGVLNEQEARALREHRAGVREGGDTNAEQDGADQPTKEGKKRPVLERADTNGDGRLDDAERAAMGAFLAERKAKAQSDRRRRPNPGTGPGTGRGPGAGGALSPFDDTRRKLIAIFDVNANEHLDPSERLWIQRVLASEAQQDGRTDRDDGTGRARDPRRDRPGAGNGRRGGVSENRQRMLDAFDANGDGELDEFERDAAREWLAERRAAARAGARDDDR